MRDSQGLRDPHIRDEPEHRGPAARREVRGPPAQARPAPSHAAQGGEFPADGQQRDDGRQQRDERRHHQVRGAVVARRRPGEGPAREAREGVGESEAGPAEAGLRGESGGHGQVGFCRIHLRMGDIFGMKLKHDWCNLI